MPIIEIIAPSSGSYNHLIDLEKSRKILESKGFELSIPKDLLSGNSPYEANTVEYRLEHLKKAVNDDNIDIIFILRGGYSSTKIAEEICKLSSFSQKKLIVGFSDLTALFAALNGKHNWLCLHGPSAISIGKNRIDPKCIEQLFDIIEGKINTLSITDLKALNRVAHVNGKPVAGKLVGGNLCVLQTTIGTHWQVDCKNKILFLEDCNEPGYKIDRMLTHLKQSHMLDGVEAIVLGEFSTINKAEIGSINHAISEFALSMKCPIYKTYAFGHGYKNTPLIIGADAEICIRDAKIELHYTWEILSFHEYQMKL